MFNRITSSGVSSKLLRYLIRKSLGGDGTNDSSNLFREYDRKCPVCEHLESVEREEVRKLAEVPFEGSTGDFVCLNHLKEVLTAAFPENKRRMTGAYVKSLEMLSDQLKLFESENYCQVSGEVRSSLWRNVEKLTGRK